jgi:alkylhydroperoxidase family enzyme
MPRIRMVEYETASPDERTTLDWIVGRYGRATNMKRTLARSPVALRAMMVWYDLHDAVRPFLGDRLTAIFCHAISAQSDCLICSTYFRRDLLDAAENPDELRLDDREEVVVAFGRQVTTDSNGVDDALYGRLASYFSEEQIVDLTAFATQMIATNIFNNALEIRLDDELERYRLRPAVGGAIGDTAGGAIGGTAGGSARG